MKRNQSKAHSDLVAAILDDLGRDPTVRVFRNPIGFDELKRISYGLIIGSTDIVACVGPYGRWLGIEVKTGRGRLRPEQIDHAVYMQSVGADIVLARNLTDARYAVARARTRLPIVCATCNRRPIQPRDRARTACWSCLPPDGGDIRGDA